MQIKTCSFWDFGERKALLLSGSQASDNTSKASKAEARGGEKGDTFSF